MKFLLLTQGKATLVDDDMYEYLNQWKWRYHSGGYASRSEHVSGSKKNRIMRHIYLHRFIMNTPEQMETDHINGNRLDNRKSNLRICTNKQNGHNMSITKRNSSGYKGVFWDKKRNKWYAYISLGEKDKYLGLFVVKEDAARAWNEAAKKYYGEYARLNIL